MLISVQSFVGRQDRFIATETGRKLVSRSSSSPRVCIIILAMLIWSNAANAHHGVDFITVETARLPHQGAGYAMARADHIAGMEDETEFEPAVLFGVTDWMSTEVHAHFARPDGGSFEYEALAPALNFRFTPRDSRFSAGVSAEYEFQRHADEEDVFGLTLMGAYDAGSWLFGANMRLETISGSDDEWSFAAGMRRAINDRIGLGLELTGSLETSDATEVLLGFYGELTDRFTLNAGLGNGTEAGTDWSLRSAFIWQFR